jgi:hypothetical protein
MDNKTIEFENNINGETVFFFGKSEKNGENILFRNFGNPYTTELRGKYILIDRRIKHNFPDYCYLKINNAVEKERCFIVTNASLIIPVSISKEELPEINLCSRADIAIKDTIKYYNAKSIKGNINCVVVTYKMRGYEGIYYDNWIVYKGKMFIAMPPENINSFNYKNIEDYSKLYFKDFTLIQ